MHASQRSILLTAALLSAWLILLLIGQSWGGAVHGLLIASWLTFPWRRHNTTQSPASDDSEPPSDASKPRI